MIFTLFLHSYAARFSVVFNGFVYIFFYAQTMFVHCSQIAAALGNIVIAVFFIEFCGFGKVLPNAFAVFMRISQNNAAQSNAFASFIQFSQSGTAKNASVIAVFF
jgi:hypothetical protein